MSYLFPSELYGSSLEISNVESYAPRHIRLVGEECDLEHARGAPTIELTPENELVLEERRSKFLGLLDGIIKHGGTDLDTLFKFIREVPFEELGDESISEFLNTHDTEEDFKVAEIAVNSFFHKDWLSEQIEESVKDQTLGGLSPISPNIKRIETIRKIGFAAEDIATVCGIGAQSVRRWVAGTSVLSPRSDSSLKLDNFRFALVKLIEGGVSPEACRTWFFSKTDIEPDNPRPIDMLERDHKTVMRLIGNLALKQL